ncbi:GatB/YqeY domain-containing protein [Candidatus Gracilibacteria bacterium]|nr:GatB/YqeY domain-containing protein [Candidatus Gracilibacteria bacterium]
MSPLQSKLNDDIKSALKSGASEKVTALRMLSAALKQVEVDSNKELDDATTITILRKELKKRQDSQQQFAAAGRSDLAEKEATEISLIEAYLPAQLSADQVTERVKSILQANNITSKADFGRAMGLVMKELGSDADGNMVKTAVTASLQ